MATFATKSSLEDSETNSLPASWPWLNAPSTQWIKTTMVSSVPQTSLEDTMLPNAKLSRMELWLKINVSLNSWIASMELEETTMERSPNKNGLTTILTYLFLLLLMTTSAEWWNKLGDVEKMNNANLSKITCVKWFHLWDNVWLLSLMATKKNTCLRKSSVISTLTATVWLLLMSSLLSWLLSKLVANVNTSRLYSPC